jgi:hypothetical protein
MKRMVLALILVLMSVCLFSAEWVPITSSEPQKPKVELISDYDGETVFMVTIPGFFIDKEEVNGESFTVLKLPGGANLMEKGNPTLPFLVTNLAIKMEGDVFVKSEEYDSFTMQVENYLPSKGHFSRNIDPETIPYTFSEVYKTNAYYPEKTSIAKEPFILRNVRGTTIQIMPFQYNPETQEMLIHPTMIINVTTEGAGGKNALLPQMRVPESKDFEAIYKNEFLNYENYSRRYTPVSEVGKLLIITYDSFYDYMLPFYYWKLQKGIPTEMVKLSTIGTTAAQVQSYIQNYYNTKGVTYILLVGDSGQMPYLNGTVGNVTSSPSDPRYALLSGSDNYAEAFVSRFPAQTTAQVQTMVNRVINYEKTPSSTASWYHQAFGIGGDDTGGSPSYADWERVDMLKAKLKSPAYNYTTFDEIYHSSATASQVSNAVNAGRGLGVYIGHGSETAWGTTGFSTSNVASLANTNMFPFILDVACLNGLFSYSSDCFGESWLKVGTSDAPKGAIAIYASSTLQSWVPPCDAQSASIDLLVGETYHTVGAICINGCMAGMDLWDATEAGQMYQQWHIFGDASTMIYTNTPTSMSVTHSGALVVGEATYNVSVSGIQNALCALYDETNHILYGQAYTNASGNATITLNPVPTSPMSLKLTVTAFNKMPYFGTVSVISPSGPYLTYQSYAVVQEISGNGDGIVNPGETIQMSITLKNVGSDEGTGISGTLSTTSSDVSITDNYAQYPDISANGTGSSITNHYTFVVGSGVANGYSIPFTLNWSATGDYSGSVNFAVPVCVPLTISGVSVTNITESSAQISWTTNVPSSSVVNYGTTTPPGSQVSDSSLVTSHSVTITGLTTCTLYRFSVSSTSAGCYTLLDTNGGSYYTFTTQGMSYKYGPEGFESGSTGWTLTGQWHQDNCKAHGGSYAMKAGAALGTCPGQYNASTTSDMTTSSSINLGSTGHGYHLRFWEYYQTESGWDYCRVQISTNGTTFTNLVDQYAGSGTTWTQRDIDLSAYTGNIWIRFEFYADSVYNYEGWYIDDVEISKPQGCSAELVYQGRTFTDSCSGTGSGNNDGYIDPGEDVSLNITLFNSGSLTGTGITGTITTTTTGVTITDGSSAFPAISSGGTGVSTDGFGISVGTGLSCGTTLNFTLHTTSNENPTGTDSYFTLTVGNVVTGSQTALYSESFDGTTFPPSGWNQVDVNGTGGNWARSTATVHPSGGGTHSGAGLAYFNSYTASSGQSTRLYRSSSTLIPSGSASAAVKFWMYHDTGYPSYTNEGVNIQISTNGSTWTTIGTLIPRYDGTTGWKEHSVDISSYIGQSVYLGILGVSQYGNDCHIDDVSLTYTTQPSCTIHACTPGCTTPSKPVISSITDVNGCSQSGITITFTSGTPATRHDLYKDGAVAQSSVTSPISYNPGDVSSHSYKIRAINSSESCYNESDAVSGTDANGTPSQPVITSIVDIDPNNLTGIQVNYTSGTPATRHDLYKDGSLAVSSYVSGATYQPGDSSTHSYVVKAINGTCTTDSAAVNGTDAYSVIAPPEIAVGANYTWPTVNQTQQTMGWNTEATATGYRVYRGTLANLGNLCNTGTDFCTRYDGTNTTLDITSDNPATIDSTNKVIYYLIVAYNAGGEGPSGTATCGTRVVNTTGTCP